MRILIVGLGSMGKRRIRNLRHLGAGEVVGFDVREDRRAEAETRYGVTTVATLEEGFDPSPDAVIISTPPDLHIPHAVEAARRGVHFFTEASVVDDGVEDLLALLRARPGLVGVPSCTMRYQPGPRKLTELVADGAVGRPLSFIYQSGQYLPDWHPWEDYRTYYVSRRVTGACREIVPFELTWLSRAFGDVVSVSAFRGKVSDLDADIDDLCQCLLGFASGVRGVLQVDALARAPVRHFRLLGALGTLEWEAATYEVRLYSAATGQWTTHPLPRGSVEKGYAEWSAEDPYVEEMRDFLAAVRGERPFGYTFEEDCQLLCVLRAAEQSCVEGRCVLLRAGLHPDFAHRPAEAKANS